MTIFKRRDLKCHVCEAKAYISGFDFDLCRAHREQAVEIAKQAVHAWIEGARLAQQKRLGLIDDILKNFEQGETDDRHH